MDHPAKPSESSTANQGQNTPSGSSAAGPDAAVDAKTSGSRSEWWLIAALGLVILVGFLFRHTSSPFYGSDISGAAYGQDFHLLDPDGHPRSLADFRGKVVTVFFGYTQCPDVCPTNLSAMASVAQKLGPDADRLQVLFITVDPGRDKPALLKEYAPAFNPHFLGLWGDAAATAKVVADFRIEVKMRPGSTPDNYLVDHSAGTYVFDTQGKLRLLLPHQHPVDHIVADIRRLLAEADQAGKK